MHVKAPPPPLEARLALLLPRSHPTPYRPAPCTPAPPNIADKSWLGSNPMAAKDGFLFLPIPLEENCVSVAFSLGRVWVVLILRLYPLKTVGLFPNDTELCRPVNITLRSISFKFPQELSQSKAHCYIDHGSWSLLRESCHNTLYILLEKSRSSILQI